jgi:hypothetical protein
LYAQDCSTNIKINYLIIPKLIFFDMKKYLNNKDWILGWMFALLSFINVTFAQTSDLTTHQPSASLPSGATFEWHNALPISASNLVASPTVAIPGLYFGVYNLGTCYSEAAPIRIATNTCPVATVDLNIFVETTGTPSGTTPTFHSASPVSDANRLSGSAITAVAVGTYYVSYRDNIIGCYSTESMIVVVNSSCCPTLANIVISNPSTCGGSNGNVKICGLTVNSTDWSVSYDKNGGSVSALTNQSADVSGCISIFGLTAGSYTNIKISHLTNCPFGSNAVSALLTDPVPPTVPIPIANNMSNICPAITVDLTTLQPLAISGVTYEWHTASNNPTASTLVSTSVAAAAGIYYLYSKSETSACYSLSSSAVTANVILCDDSDHDNLPDTTDLDDDNDGILDTVENATSCSGVLGLLTVNSDCDGDGIPNRLDLDSDNDGINDVVEAGGTDADGNGNADGIISISGIPASAGSGLSPPNTDAQGGANPYDLDSDNDGLLDLIEGGLANSLDTNDDGLVDCSTNCDSDNDGILTPVDAIPNIWGDTLLPDLSPTTEIASLEFLTAGTQKDFVVNVFEINSISNITGQPIAFRVAKTSAFDITYAVTSGISNVFSTVNNSNSDWIFTETANFIIVTAKSGIAIPIGGSKVVGFRATRKPGIPQNTSQNITVTIIYGSAGEEKVDNNIVETKITAN